MKYEPTFLIDYPNGSRAIVENFTKLVLLLRELCLAMREVGDVVKPKDPLATDETDMSSTVRHLHIGQ